MSQIAVGGQRANDAVAIRRLRAYTDYAVIQQPSLRGQVRPCSLIWAAIREFARKIRH